MTDEKSKKSCLPSILMLIGFFLFILAAIAIPSMDKNSRYIGGIFAVISLCISLTGFILKNEPVVTGYKLALDIKSQVKLVII